MLSTGIIFLLVAGTLVTGIALTRQWALDQRGIDLESESMGVTEVKHFTSKQKLLLTFLVAPVVLVLVIGLAYLLASVVLTAVGVTMAAV